MSQYFYLKKILILVYVSLRVYHRKEGAYGGQERALDPLEQLNVCGKPNWGESHLQPLNNYISLNGLKAKRPALSIILACL